MSLISHFLNHFHLSVRSCNKNPFLLLRPITMANVSRNSDSLNAFVVLFHEPLGSSDALIRPSPPPSSKQSNINTLSHPNCLVHLEKMLAFPNHSPQNRPDSCIATSISKKIFQYGGPSAAPPGTSSSTPTG